MCLLPGVNRKKNVTSPEALEHVRNLRNTYWNVLKLFSQYHSIIRTIKVEHREYFRRAN